MAAVAAAAVLLVLGGMRWFERSGGGATASVAVGRPTDLPRPARRRQVFVHVAGAVRRPGVYALPRGSRGGDAVERAGGPRRSADLTAVNLAAVLRDGQQLVVPPSGAAAGGSAPTGGAAGGGGGAKLPLSTATAAQLEGLDGIGPALAARILAYRDAHGGFRSVDELAEVEGIGDKRLEALRHSVTP